MDNAQRVREAAKRISGWLTQNEMTLLYDYARQCKTAVEIGSYQGQSTVCLALGARESGGTVWAVDPHIAYVERSPDGHATTRFGPADNIAFMRNVAEYGDVVRVINAASERARKIVATPDMVFIDGCHTYACALEDFELWQGARWILFHDRKYPDVAKVIQEALSRGFVTVETCDSIHVIEHEDAGTT